MAKRVRRVAAAFLLPIVVFLVIAVTGSLQGWPGAFTGVVSVTTTVIFLLLSLMSESELRVTRDRE